MKWSIRLGSFRGIPVRMHLTFLLLLAWVGWIYWRQEGTASAVVSGIVFILGIFVCVLLHEFGHALTARRFGIRTRDVTLLPIGGLARLERMPEDPVQELWVAAAGPAVNVAIAAALWLWLLAVGRGPLAFELGVLSGPFAVRLMIVNVLLVVFNLIPAFPMDGGRILRALLATRMDYARATQIAATLGQATALVFGVVGLFRDPLLLFIALFVWIGAAHESGLAELRTALHGVPVSRVMVTDFRALAPDSTLVDAVGLTLAGSQKDFPVVQGGRILGIVLQRDILRGLAHGGPQVAVASLMSREYDVVHPRDMLEGLFQRLSESGRHAAAVLGDDDRLVGLVTLDNVAEYLAIQGALAGGRGPRVRTPS